MKTIRFCTILLFLILFSFAPVHATTIIDLNDFFADPTITVALDGSSALMAEDPNFFTVLLSNDPGLGDPNVILPEIGGISQILSFDFNFTEPSGNDDEFGAFVLDSFGSSAGPGFEFFTQNPGSGTVSWGLSSLIGNTLGLQFQLSALPGAVALDSTVTVSNVKLNPVPEPTTLLLVGSGLFGLLGIGRKKFLNPTSWSSRLNLMISE